MVTSSPRSELGERLQSPSTPATQAGLRHPGSSQMELLETDPMAPVLALCGWPHLKLGMITQKEKKNPEPRQSHLALFHKERRCVPSIAADQWQEKFTRPTMRPSLILFHVPALKILEYLLIISFLDHSLSNSHPGVTDG